MRNSDVTGIVALAVCFVTGCTSTRYMGPPLVTAPVPQVHSTASRHHHPQPTSLPERDLPDDVPRVDCATPAGLELVFANGTRLLLPAGTNYQVVRKDHRLGAAEGAIGGLLAGAAAGGIAAANGECADCAGAAMVAGVLIVTGLGALYGGLVGHTTTYVYGPSPRAGAAPP